MLLLPAIDLRDGRCVRLLRGSFSSATQYPDDPAEMARGFEQKGIRWIHIVDLDAAEGKGKDNLAVIERVEAPCPAGWKWGAECARRNRRPVFSSWEWT